MRQLFLLLLVSLPLLGAAQKKKLIFLLQQGGEQADANIALGTTFLTTNAKTRAYWDFTSLGVSDGTVLSSYNDLSVGGVWDLDNASGVNNPKAGIIQRGTSYTTALRAKTPSTYKEAFKTTSAATNLLKNDVEVHLLINLEDGQIGTNILFGSADGGTRYFRFRVTSTGLLQLEYAAGASGLSTIISTGTVLPDGLTGVYLIRLRCDFTTDVISGMINGIPITFSVSSGNAISTWNAANWVSTRSCGVGGSYDGAFTADAIVVKYILKGAVTDLLTDDEYLILAASFLNY